MLTRAGVLTRRALLVLGGAALLTAATEDVDPDAEQNNQGDAPDPTGDHIRVGLVTVREPAGAQPITVPTGWDWAVENEVGVQLLVKGHVAASTPELALAMVPLPTGSGRFQYTVRGNPVVSVTGADAHRAWSLRSTALDEAGAASVRTGTLVAGTLGRQTGVLLVSGPAGWSPSVRRAVLASMGVSVDA